MKNKKLTLLFVFILLFTFIFSGCEYKDESQVISPSGENNLVVHFIDIGQGDSIFIQLPNGQTSLIDGGSKIYEDTLCDYLTKLGVKKIDYLVATHPHEDHIGGLPKVIKQFDIGKIYMPDKTSNTKIFEELLNEIKSKGLHITVGHGGDKIAEDDEFSYDIFAPNNDDYGEINNYSIVTKIQFKGVSFLFTGDAENISEKEMIDKNYDLKSDILKVGHHGGRTSSTKEFLEEVMPKYAVISAGKDNMYNHPHKETLDRLKAIGAQVYRTDESGTVIVTTDGSNIKISTVKSKSDSQDKVFIGNKNTKVYHSEDCGSLPKEENRVYFNTKEEAEKSGYKPHGKCIK